jgi:excisionase family DNA binding protein
VAVITELQTRLPAPANSELLEQLIRPIVEKILGEREASATPLRPEAYMTVKQASMQSGIPEQTLRKWISQKRVPAYRAAGRSVRVRLSDILNGGD